jgi:bifunctional DNA-binding transcriptional regulator/antitoxin component of YhaV-PrlF toxin-antitoxin module
MVRVHISDEGEITLPQELLKCLGWSEGTKIEVESQDGFVVLHAVRPIARTTVDDVLGCIPYSGPPVSIEEMDVGVTEAARRMWDDFERQKA